MSSLSPSIYSSVISVMKMLKGRRSNFWLRRLQGSGYQSYAPWSFCIKLKARLQEESLQLFSNLLTIETQMELDFTAMGTIENFMPFVEGSLQNFAQNKLKPPLPKALYHPRPNLCHRLSRTSPAHHSKHNRTSLWRSPWQVSLSIGACPLER